MRASAPPAALGAALVLSAGLAGCVQTSTYGTGEMPEMAIFREITGGFGAKKKQPIQYQPRAPLVLPPSTDGAAVAELPPPAEAAETADAAWPIDPDQTPPGDKFGDPRDENAADDISPEEARRLAPLAALNQGRSTRFVDTWKGNQAMDVVNREQRETFKAALDEAEGVGRTERRYLTEPPDAYRQPAASAPTEFEDIKRNRQGWLSRLFAGGRGG
jgi:hypothetical protein